MILIESAMQLVQLIFMDILLRVYAKVLVRMVCLIQPATFVNIVILTAKIAKELLSIVLTANMDGSYQEIPASFLQVNKFYS